MNDTNTWHFDGRATWGEDDGETLKFEVPVLRVNNKITAPTAEEIAKAYREHTHEEPVEVRKVTKMGDWKIVLVGFNGYRTDEALLVVNTSAILSD